MGPIRIEALGGDEPLSAARMNRVVHVIPSIATRTGGPAVAVAELVAGLTEIGIDAEIVTTDLGGPAGFGRSLQKEDLPAAVQDSWLHSFSVSRLRRFAYAPDMKSFLRAQAATIDLIHIHSLFLYPQYAAYAVARRGNVPYIVSPRGALDQWHRRRGRVRKSVVGAIWQNRLLAHAGGLHITSAQEEAMISDVSPETPRFCLPNAIDVRFWNVPAKTRPEIRSELAIPNDAPLLMFSGRVTRKKRLDLLIRALALLQGTELVVAGPDNENLKIRVYDPLAAHLGVMGRVHWLGHVRADRLRDLLHAADVWVLPSETENFGNAAVEAMAAGVPVVLSHGVAVAPEAHDAHAARVFRNMTADDLSKCIRAALSSPARNRRSIQAFAQRFDRVLVAGSYAEMYQTVSAPASKTTST